jgi:C-terminal processing protease CtpA/Prc
MTSFAPSEDVRRQLIETVVTTCEQRFYDPHLHGVSVRDLLGREQSRLLRTSTFTTDINNLLAGLEAYPIEFGHESERRVGLWKAIKCSFFRWNGAWIFQDVLIGGHARAAGVRPGAALIAIDETEASDSDIPRFKPSARVKITFKNPGQSEQSFEFDPAEKEDESRTQYVEHRRLDDRVGYIRVSKFAGILGMGVAKKIDSAIRALRNPDALVVDMRGNLGSAGGGNLRLMSYLTPDRVPVGYSLTRARAQQGYRREELAQFTEIPRLKLLAPLTLLKFKDGDKSITVVTEGLGKKSFHGRIVMLVNEHTISGGEIVAGFAADHKLATLVGSPTAGKLLGWTSISVGHECFLTLPTVNYVTWEGRTFERTGVTPDHYVPFSPEAAIAGIDNQLAAAAELARSL